MRAVRFVNGLCFFLDVSIVAVGVLVAGPGARVVGLVIGKNYGSLCQLIQGCFIMLHNIA